MKITLTYKQHQPGIEFVKTFDSWKNLHSFLDSGKFGDICDQFDFEEKDGYEEVLRDGKTYEMRTCEDWCRFLLPIVLADYTYTLEVQP
jgi:hypothetical protein